jgi:hypothetical protein
MEHKAEHNNCRMRGHDPDLEPSGSQTMTHATYSTVPKFSGE